MLMKQAIAGNMIDVDVPYYKKYRQTSVAHQALFRDTQYSIKELQDIANGWVDLYVQMYNMAHPYSKNSTEFAMFLYKKLQEKKFYKSKHHAPNYIKTTACDNFLKIIQKQILKDF